MSAALILRTASRADLSMPWPIRIEADGTVTHGRPDADRIIGFQAVLEVQTVDLTWEDALLSPTLAVGMFPVYTGDLSDGYTNAGRGLFVTGDAVVSLEAVAA